MQLDTYSNK